MYHSPCKTVGVVVLLFEDSNWFVHLAKNRFTNNVLGVNNGVLLCILYIGSSFFQGQPFLWYFIFQRRRRRRRRIRRLVRRLSQPRYSGTNCENSFSLLDDDVYYNGLVIIIKYCVNNTCTSFIRFAIGLI
jgi:hypothetical protein